MLAYVSGTLTIGNKPNQLAIMKCVIPNKIKKLEIEPQGTDCVRPIHDFETQTI